MSGLGEKERQVERTGHTGLWNVLGVVAGMCFCVGKEKNLGCGVAEVTQEGPQKPWVLLQGAGWAFL